MLSKLDLEAWIVIGAVIVVILITLNCFLLFKCLQWKRKHTIYVENTAKQFENETDLERGTVLSQSGNSTSGGYITRRTNGSSIDTMTTDRFDSLVSFPANLLVNGRLSKQPIKQWIRGRKIGRGAFGDVYLAIDTATGSLFCVKQVPIQKDMNGQRLFEKKLKALECEMKVLKNLHHTNIVNYLGTSRSQKNLYLQLEYVSIKFI